MRKERSVKMNILMCIAMILLCVTLFSLFVVSNMYARYTESIDNGDSARVAKFSIKPGDEFDEELKAKTVPGKSESLILEIENDSEVAVEYTITVTKVTDNLPLEITLTPEDSTGEDKNPNSISGDGGKKTSINISRQIPIEHTDKFKLKMEWEPNSNDSEADLALMGMVDYITVSIKATQID